MLRSGFIWNEKDIPEKSRALIRQVLMKDWDPIGVEGIPEAVDEYDSYIPRVYQLLSTKAALVEIQDYLFEVVSTRMGMSPPVTLEHMKPAADALKRIETEI